MKRTLYVVDDQAPVMETALVILRRTDKNWEVSGFTDPTAALEAVKVNAPDLVLSDQLMPGMQGTQMLEQVRTISPKTIRIIMSGYVALSTLEMITSAHQYLSKPFDNNGLRELVKRSFAAQDRLVSPGLQAVATGLRSIPSLPQVHHSLLRELEDDRTASAAIARVVGDDPGLSIKVLHLANSPLFGRGAVVTNPADAVMCLGTDMISAIVLSQSMFRHYENLKKGDVDLPRVWTHSWETARMAQHLCREKRLGSQSGEEAFLAGLMHEIGRFLIVDNFPAEFEAACAMSRQKHQSLALSLQETLHATPSQVGAYVLELWGLAPGVVDAIGALDKPGEGAEEGFSLRAALYIAEHIAHAKHPADSFPVEPWKADYIKLIECEAEIPVWEKFFSDTKGKAAK